MPHKAPHNCIIPGCTNTVDRGNHCRAHKYLQRLPERKQESGCSPVGGQAKTDAPPSSDARPHSAARGYGWRWQAYRRSYLRRNPICNTPECGAPATVIDHIVDHKGDKALFWNKKNHQPKCKACHDRKTWATTFGSKFKTTVVLPSGHTVKIDPAEDERPEGIDDELMFV